MQKYKAVVEYHGTQYSGMQRQTGQKTIQGSIENALSQFANCSVEIDFCGRTDAGVHALGQVIHFSLNKQTDCYSVLRGINFYLKEEKIAIISVEEVDENFHCRFNAKKRFYVYKVLQRKTPSPIYHNLVYRVPYKLNIKNMQLAANLLVGKTADFSSFCSNECQAHSKIKTIDNIKIECIDDFIEFHFEAKSFLHNMVRIITGTLLEVGRGKMNTSCIAEILEAKDRTKAGATVPPYGLYFLKVLY